MRSHSISRSFPIGGAFTISFSSRLRTTPSTPSIRRPGATLWHVSLLGSGETPSDDRGCDQITPEIGVTSTPVIDRGAGPNGAIFVVAMSKDSSSNYYQRLHALDITTGAELFNGPVTVNPTYSSAAGGQQTFSPGQYAERAALLLENGTIYTSWTSHCDSPALFRMGSRLQREHARADRRPQHSGGQRAAAPRYG